MKKYWMSDCVRRTFAPRLASSYATCAPIPRGREAPVTMATFPARLGAMSVVRVLKIQAGGL